MAGSNGSVLLEWTWFSVTLASIRRGPFLRNVQRLRDGDSILLQDSRVGLIFYPPIVRVVSFPIYSSFQL